MMWPIKADAYGSDTATMQVLISLFNLIAYFAAYFELYMMIDIFTLSIRIFGWIFIYTGLKENRVKNADLKWHKFGIKHEMLWLSKIVKIIYT